MISESQKSCSCGGSSDNEADGGDWDKQSWMEERLEEKDWLEQSAMDDGESVTGCADDDFSDSDPAPVERRLTEMTVNWLGSETSLFNSNRFAGLDIASVVCNRMAYSELVYYCIPPRKKCCFGMHIAYNPNDPREVQAVNRFLAVLNNCGLPATLTPVKGNCCISRKQQYKVTIAPGAIPGAGMGRTAAKISSATRGFCLEINAKLMGDVDLYTRSSTREESQFNPNNFNLPGYRNFRFAGLNKAYNRRPCDLLAHVVAENYYGNYCTKKGRVYVKYEFAHGKAIAEENWVRFKRGAKDMIRLADKKVNPVVIRHEGTIKKEETPAAGKGKGKAGGKAALGNCKSASTVTCTNECPGGRCCSDKVTPKGWVSCQDICKPGSKACPV